MPFSIGMEGIALQFRIGMNVGNRFSFPGNDNAVCVEVT